MCLSWLRMPVAIQCWRGRDRDHTHPPTLQPSDYYLVKTLAHWGSCGLLSELEWKVIRASVEKRDNWGTQVTLTRGSLHFWQKLFNHLSNLHIARNRKLCHIHTLITCESTRTHTCTQIRMHAHTHARTHTRMHAHTHACTHACTHTYAHTHTCTHAHTHTHIYTLTHFVSLYRCLAILINLSYREELQNRNTRKQK